MKKDFAGKWALVTGASSGIGLEMAVELAAAGMNLVLVARREEALEALAVRLRASGVEALPLASDLQRPGEPERILSILAGKGIALSVLVNNAGFGIHGAFDGIDEEREEGMVELNVKALVRLTRLFVKPMKAAGLGRILFTSSIGAFQPSPTYAVYCATKSFVQSYGLAVRQELKGTGVTATVLYPGVTDTAFHDVAGHATGTSAFKRATAMSAAEVARPAVRALLRGRAECVPGASNRFLAFATRLLPRPALAAITASLME